MEGEAGSVQPEAEVPAVDVDELENHVNDGAFLLDVRQPDEYETAHVPGAVLVPLSELGERLGEVPSGEPVYVICHSGGRSRKATAALRSVGIEASNVTGGTQAWIDAGKTIAEGPAPA